jgi:hypothetical protein
VDSDRPREEGESSGSSRHSGTGLRKEVGRRSGSGEYPERCGEEPSPHLGTSVFWWGFTGRGVGEGRYFEDVVKKHGLVAGLCELVAPFTTRYHCDQQCPKAIPGRGLLDWQFRGAWLHGF